MSRKYITARNLCRDALAMVGQFTYAQVDCIRVITNPMKAAGKTFDYLGSNYFVRYEVENLQRLTSESQLAAGKALFRSKEPNESGYALPDRYKAGSACDTGDYLDYHHIGLYVGDGRIVDSNKTATQDGPAISTNWRAWEWVADIVAVEYPAAGTPDAGTGGGEETMNTATVNTNGKGPLNFRQGPSTNYKLCARNPKVPEGAVVEVLEARGEWTRIIYNGETGWVLGQYLTPGGTVDEVPEPVPAPVEENGGDTVTIPRADAERIITLLQTAINK